MSYLIQQGPRKYTQTVRIKKQLDKHKNKPHKRIILCIISTPQKPGVQTPENAEESSTDQ